MYCVWKWNGRRFITDCGKEQRKCEYLYCPFCNNVIKVVVEPKRSCGNVTGKTIIDEWVGANEHKAKEQAPRSSDK